MRARPQPDQRPRPGSGSDELAPLVRLVRELYPSRTRTLMAQCRGDAAATVIALARAHQVEAWLAGCAPADQQQWAVLHSQRPRFAASRMRDRAEVQAFAEAMRAVGAPWAVLKGPALAQSVYPRADLRFGVDLDLLVSPSAVAAVLAELERRDYQLLDLNWPLMVATRPGEVKVRSPRGVLIDLHWSVLSDVRVRSLFGLCPDDLLSRRRLLASGTPALDEIDQFMHVAIHAAQSGGNRLSWLMDVALGARQLTDWTAVSERAREAGVGPVLALVLQRSSRYFDIGMPDGALDAFGAAGWRAASAVVDRFSPLRADCNAPALNRSVARSARRTGRSSVVELVRHGGLWLRSGAPKTAVTPDWVDPTHVSSTMFPVNDPAARDRFFREVAAEGRVPRR